MRTKDIDFSTIHEMSDEQKAQVYYTLAKRANQRMRDVNKSTGDDSPIIKQTKKYLNAIYGRNTFVQSKKLIGVDLEEGLRTLEKFFKAKSSSVQGIKEIRLKHEKLFEEKGIKIKDSKKFFQFLGSQQFKTLAKYADSDQIIEDFTSATSEGFSFDAIMKGYDEFLNNDMTFEQVEERRHNGGELLH